MSQHKLTPKEFLINKHLLFKADIPCNIICRECKCQIPNDFLTAGFCPYCRSIHGIHARICLYCEKVFLSIFHFCRGCGDRTIEIETKESELIAVALHLKGRPELMSRFISGIPFKDLSKGFKKLSNPESAGDFHNLFRDDILRQFQRNIALNAEAKNSRKHNGKTVTNLGK